jgi:hypothetical protein
MRGARAAVGASALLALLLVAPAARAEETQLTYSIKDARAFLWQIHYPQSTFVTQFYAPCDPETDPYGCDRGRYNQRPGSCDPAVALGRTKEAPETPTEQEARSGVSDDAGTAPPDAWPKGNPVTLVHGLAFGRLGATPEAGGLASAFYVDNVGRQEPEAHAESDAFVSNKSDYEERCAAVDALSESQAYPAPFSAHVLSRADRTPATYNMVALTTFEATGRSAPPGVSKESVAIVKLWQEGGRVRGILSSTVRGARLADGITVDLVRTVVAFSSNGTRRGLEVHASTAVLGVAIGGLRIAALRAGSVVPLGGSSYLGVARPVVQVSAAGDELVVRAAGLFLAVETPLDRIPIPEDPFQEEEPLGGLRGQLGEVRAALCQALGQDPARPPCRLTLGGRLFRSQVIHVAGALLNAGLGRAAVPTFPALPPLPPPRLPAPAPPGLPPLALPAPAEGSVPPAVVREVALPRFEFRELEGSPAPLLAILAGTLLGLGAVLGRWSMRYPWARALARTPPAEALGWVWRAFLKD